MTPSRPIPIRVAGIALFLGTLVPAAQTETMNSRDCERLLSDETGYAAHSTPGARLELNPTTELIALLDSLLKEQDLRGAPIVGDDELLRLIAALESGRFENPIPEARAKTSSTALVYRDAIEASIAQSSDPSGNQLELPKLLAWAKAAVEEKSRIRVVRGQTREETRSVFRKMKFRPLVLQLASGEHRIELMETDVTQKMWVDEYGENPAHFKTGDSTLRLSRNGKEILLQPDHPVERITWWSAADFANRMSVQADLDPVFDLSRIRFNEDSSPAQGNWVPDIGFNSHWALRLLKINDTNGYRFPTVAEYEALQRILHPTDAELTEVAWTQENSDGRTHAVGSTPKSHSIQGQVFSDLFGNVATWTMDGPPDSPNSKRVARGGSWRDRAGYILSTPPKFGDEPSKRYDSFGLRLVRTIAK